MLPATETRTLLIEIGTEDLPPGLMREYRGFHALLLDLLQKEQFVDPSPTPPDSPPWLYTPRRLAVKISGVKPCQPERTERRVGPPSTHADPGNPAVAGFARSCGVEPEQLEIHDGRLCCDVKTGGQTLQDILPSLLLSALKRIHIERRMRWGAQGEHAFARPVRWLCALHGEEVIDFELYGVRSGRATYGHRFHCPEPLQLQCAEDYEKKLADTGHVIVDVNRRRETILTQLDSVAPGCLMPGDEPRSDEATAITEWPQVLNAAFDEKFLTLPPEVITEALETGLKAFVQKAPDSTGPLPQISVVADVESSAPEAIRRGYERVARARLEDARFFFERGRKTTLESRRKLLERTLFQEKLGTLADKSRRLAQLAEWIARQYGASPEHARRAAELCKCDLGSDIVGEYPQLQGIIGGYYAAADGEDNQVATAIREHYRPHRLDDIPKAPVSVALAIADKTDTLAGFWRIGAKPSSSKDPYGLGRAVEAILLLIMENKIDLNLLELTARATTLYNTPSDDGDPSNDEYPLEIKADLDRYIAGRLGRVAALYVRNTTGETAARITALAESVARAQPAPTQSYDFVCRLQAMVTFVKDPAAESLIQTSKRIGNLLKQSGADEDEPRPDLLSEPAERALLAAMTGCQDDFDLQFSKRRYAKAMKTLAGLREPVDRFFDNILIMTDDPALRNSRLALLKKARRMFFRVADFSCIPPTPDDAGSLR